MNYHYRLFAPPHFQTNLFLWFASPALPRQGLPCQNDPSTPPNQIEK